MANIEYTEMNEEGLVFTGPLRCKLIDHHIEITPGYFRKRFDGWNAEKKNKELLEKFANGLIRVDLARDRDTGEPVGYCISTISENKQGEIASIFVEPEYRHYGIADNMMEKALRWMDERAVTKKILEVGTGNEEVFAFYRRYNFYPRTTILEQVEAAGEDKGNQVDAQL